MSRRLVWSALLPAVFASATLLVVTVPTEIQQPGTQPLEVSNLGTVSNCDNCHGGYDPAVEQAFNWRGSMMAHASRDPLFWATMAIAEQSFAGVGDLCLRCHTPRAWLEGRSTPTDGSGITNADVDGTECAICHKMVDPDDSEHVGVQNAPYLAHDEGTPKTGYYGSGMMVMWDGQERMGPYADPVARHATLQSRFHRSEDFCGTCHDVSNPLVGDLAHNHGAALPLQPGTYSGVLGSPVAGKAAFQNFPYAYGVVERTYSEHKASRWPRTPVANYATLPVELQDGAVAAARAAALLAGPTGNYADGTTRSFTCQTCHLSAVRGQGCNKNNAPVRADLPLHDLTGGSYWMPDVLRYMDARNKLRVGGGLSQQQLDALDAGKRRAQRQLRLAANLAVSGNTATVVNLTGHKLISGYPEGRRMWLRVTWRDGLGRTLRQDGSYGPITAMVHGAPRQVETILDLAGTHTRIWEAKPGMTREWASQLLGLGIAAATPVGYDRSSGAPTLTLGGLAALPPGSVRPTFHFALNNTLVADNRIPPWGMAYDEARTRNALPVPASLFGDPGPGGTYRHRDEVALSPPAAAATATLELLYQSTSWEYVQFLWLANDRRIPFLATVGDDLLDAWLNTGMAAPQVMTSMIWCRLPGTGEDLTLTTRVNGRGNPDDCAKAVVANDRLDIVVASGRGTFVGAVAALLLQVQPAGQPPVAVLPGLHLNRIDAQVVAALPAGGLGVGLVAPPGAAGLVLRLQAAVLSTAAGNGLYATSDAHEVLFR